MSNCTYTIRRPGHTAFCQSPNLLAAIKDREIANRTCTHGHRIYRESGDVTTEVEQDEIEQARADHSALIARTSLPEGMRTEDAVELGYPRTH